MGWSVPGNVRSAFAGARLTRTTLTSGNVSASALFCARCSSTLRCERRGKSPTRSKTRSAAMITMAATPIDLRERVASATGRAHGELLLDRRGLWQHDLVQRLALADRRVDHRDDDQRVHARDQQSADHGAPQWRILLASFCE